MAFKAKGSDGRVVSMVAKYSSVCKCGAFIEPGDQMSYDTLTRKTFCYDCLRKELDFQKSSSSNVSSKNSAPGITSASIAYVDVSGSEYELARARTELPARDECHGLIDRFREFRLATRPVSAETKEALKVLLIRFINEFGTSEPVRAFVAEIAKCKHSGADFCPIKAKFPSACIHCGTTVKVGQLVLYDHHARRVHCLVCDCLRGI